MGGGVRSLIRRAAESRRLLLDARKISGLEPAAKHEVAEDGMDDDLSHRRAEAMGHKQMPLSAGITTENMLEEHPTDLVQQQSRNHMKEEGDVHDDSQEQQPALETKAEVRLPTKPVEELSDHRALEALDTFTIESPVPHSRINADTSSKGAHRGESDLSLLSLSIVRERDSHLFNPELSAGLADEGDKWKDCSSLPVSDKHCSDRRRLGLVKHWRVDLKGPLRGNQAEVRHEPSSGGEGSFPPCLSALRIDHCTSTLSVLLTSLLAGNSVDVSLERGRALKSFKQYVIRRMCFRWQSRAGTIAFRKWYMEWRTSCLRDIHTQCDVASGLITDGDVAASPFASQEDRETQIDSSWSSVSQRSSADSLAVSSVSTQTVAAGPGEEQVARSGEHGGFASAITMEALMMKAQAEMLEQECQTADYDVTNVEIQTSLSWSDVTTQTSSMNMTSESAQTEAVNIVEASYVIHTECQMNNRGTNVEIQTLPNSNDEMTTQTETSDLVDMFAQTAFVDITHQSAQTTAVINNAIHTQTFAMEHADYEQIDVARGPLPPPREVSETFAPVALGASSPSLSGDLDLSLRSRREEISPLARSSESNLLFNEVNRDVLLSPDQRLVCPMASG
eukprot:748735-Hanusia_phi.AAC.1